MLDVVYPWAAGASALLSDVALPPRCASGHAPYLGRVKHAPRQTAWLPSRRPEDIALPLGKKAAKAAAADDVDIISTLASDANPNPGAAKRATKSPKRDKAALRFHE